MATSTTHTPPRTAGLVLAGLTVAAPIGVALLAPGAAAPLLAMVLPFFTIMLLDGPSAESEVAAAAPTAAARERAPRLSGRVSVA